METLSRPTYRKTEHSTRKAMKDPYESHQGVLALQHSPLGPRKKIFLTSTPFLMSVLPIRMPKEGGSCKQACCTVVQQRPVHCVELAKQSSRASSSAETQKRHRRGLGHRPFDLSLNPFRFHPPQREEREGNRTGRATPPSTCRGDGRRMTHESGSAKTTTWQIQMCGWMTKLRSTRDAARRRRHESSASTSTCS